MMCEECSVEKVGALIGDLRRALEGLDREGEHAAAALVDEAIRMLERNATTW